MNDLRIRPGDPITDFAASDYNEIAAEIERLANLSVSAPLELSQGPSGNVLSASLTDGFYARITGTGNPYTWQEVIRQDGAWVDGFRSGDNAYDVNG